MLFTERQTLELIQKIAISRYKSTGDNWWKRLECSVRKKLETKEGKWWKK